MKDDDDLPDPLPFWLDVDAERLKRHESRPFNRNGRRRIVGIEGLFFLRLCRKDQKVGSNTAADQRDQRKHGDDDQGNSSQCRLLALFYRATEMLKARFRELYQLSGAIPDFHSCPCFQPADLGYSKANASGEFRNGGRVVWRGGE